MHPVKQSDITHDVIIFSIRWQNFKFENLKTAGNNSPPYRILGLQSFRFDQLESSEYNTE